MARKVCVMTSAHPAFDVRIFHKECKSLARAGYQVTLIASSAEQGAFDGIDLKPLPKWKNRWDRMTRGPFVVYRKAREENADVYHFHDPELIPAALLLRRAGKRVIYDIHEDLPRTVSYKPYIPGFLKSLVSRAVERIENWAGARFSALIAANPTIAGRFRERSPNLSVVSNFPKVEEIEPVSHVSSSQREPCLIYVGMRITRSRGIEEVIRAVGLLSPHLHARLKLVGNWDPPDLPKSLSKIPGWDRVEFLGPLGRGGVVDQLTKARVGLSILRPEPNYLTAQPVKLFEYMCAGIPVIASDFPVCRDIVAKSHCGLLVDPLNPEEIARAMEFLLIHQDYAEAMGQRGLQAVRQHYNWAEEEKVLLQTYQDLFFYDTACSEDLVHARCAR